MATHDLAVALDTVWDELPRQLVPLMRRELTGLTELVCREIRAKVPEYARLDEQYDRAMRAGIEHAINGFLGRVVHEPHWVEQAESVHRAIGRGELREGRSLDALQSAYRIGARLSWRRWAALGRAANVPASVLYRSAEAIFAHIEELAGYAVEGYAAARTEAVGERRENRRRLLEMVLADPPVVSEAITAQAEAAQWRLPAAVTMIALAPRQSPHGELATALAERPLNDLVLADLSGNRPFLLVDRASVDTVVEVIGRLPAPLVAAVGPAVRLAEAGVSLRCSRYLLDLIGQNEEPTPVARVVRWHDQFSGLMLLTDKEVARTLASQRLAALNIYKPNQRRRMAETLLAWLTYHGNTQEIAKELNVHPQTVRYRLRQLGEAFGPQMRDPARRFELQLALVTERLTGADQPASTGSAPRIPGRTGAPVVPVAPVTPVASVRNGTAPGRAPAGAPPRKPAGAAVRKPVTKPVPVNRPRPAVGPRPAAAHG